MLNNVSGFVPDPSTGSTAQIYLDSGTSRDLVVCAEKVRAVGDYWIALILMVIALASSAVSPSALAWRSKLTVIQSKPSSSCAELE